MHFLVPRKFSWKEGYVIEDPVVALLSRFPIGIQQTANVLSSKNLTSASAPEPFDLVKQEVSQRAADQSVAGAPLFGPA